MSDERALLTAIAAAPDDVNRILVYADFLLSRGDPRGELIMVMHAREERPDDGALARRQEELLTRSARALLGRLSKHGQYVELAWRRGFISVATLINREQSPARSRLARLVTLLAEAPASLLVEELRLVGPDVAVVQEAITALETHPLPLAALTFASSSWPFDGQYDWRDPYDPVEPAERPDSWPAPRRPLSLTFRGLVPRRLPSLVAEADALTVEGSVGDTLALALVAIHERRGAKRPAQLTLVRPTLDAIRSLATLGLAVEGLVLVDASRDALDEFAGVVRGVRPPPLGYAIRSAMATADARRLLGDLPVAWL